MVNCAECENSKCKRIEELACAIVIQAVKDYRDARTILAKKPKDKKNNKKVQEDGRRVRDVFLVRVVRATYFHRRKDAAWKITR